MTAQPRTHLTPEEYFAYEMETEWRNEYWDGEMFSMAGGSPENVQIETNLVGALYGQLKGGPCRIFSGNMRAKITGTRYTYPDVSGLCGEPAFAPTGGATLLNPALLIEVLSPGTERYDRGRKFLAYQAIESLREYVLVAQTEARVEKFTRSENGGWLWSQVEGLDARLTLETLGCSVPLRDLYDGVTFPPEEEPRMPPPVAP